MKTRDTINLTKKKPTKKQCTDKSAGVQTILKY